MRQVQAGASFQAQTSGCQLLLPPTLRQTRSAAACLPVAGFGPKSFGKASSASAVSNVTRRWLAGCEQRGPVRGACCGQMCLKGGPGDASAHGSRHGGYSTCKPALQLLVVPRMKPAQQQQHPAAAAAQAGWSAAQHRPHL